ncbi:Autophagy-related protein 8 [Choanephora cucurbitarum]|uniref:Autophagy-related protein n=1 Tax=Choanephora cucurbitarum TaxID=101091 RepID=A0A1C7NKQ3_9FUNG|nr:Autophagy-related protein 8 [Choanephora cucurbitarum]
MGFKEDYSFELRKAEATRIKNKFVDRVPVVCQRIERNKAPLLKKKRYLVPKDFTLGQFIHVIRQRIQLSHEHALFIFINDSIVPVMSGKR